jgi:hypothetical protein
MGGLKINEKLCTEPHGGKIKSPAKRKDNSTGHPPGNLQLWEDSYLITSSFIG